MEPLKRQRANAKSAITRIFNYCTGPDATDEGIQVRSEKLDEYFNTFETAQNEVESEPMSSEQAEEEVKYRAQVEDNYYAIKAIATRRQVNANTNNSGSEHNEQSNLQITHVLDTLTRNQSTLGTLLERLSRNTSTPLPHTADGVNHQNLVRLPRITLPDFDGAYTSWMHFRDLFEALVHVRTNISDIEKFEYLKSHLKGDALSLIKHLNHSSENYQIGWKLLKERYDKSDLIKKNYLKILFDQVPMKGPFTAELKRLINTTNECLNALTAMKEPTDQWESILLFHLERKLDWESRALWSRTAVESVTFKNFREFLERRLRELEICQHNKEHTHQVASKQRSQSNVHVTSTNNCQACQQTHQLYKCYKFKDLNVNDRFEIAKRNNLCYNCLQSGHLAPKCMKSTCTRCNGKHHTLLHREVSTRPNPNSTNMPSESNSMDVNAVYTKGNKKFTLLPTAIAMILGSDGEYHPCRILLDTGAQTTLVSETCVRRLNLKRSFDKTILCGVGGENKSCARGKVQLQLKSNVNARSINTVALCLQRLTQLQPAYQVSTNELDYFRNLELADPACNVPNRIDVILGANVFSEWSLNQQIVHPSGSPSALSTIFGWVIIGDVTITRNHQVTVAHTTIDLSKQLQRFWEIEELQDSKPHLTDEEQMAETHYQQTVYRDDTGRYVVRLPFKGSNPSCGDTKTQAVKRLATMEKRFAINPRLFHDYRKFMDEYIQLNHMEPVNDSKLGQYFLPHHAVLKADSTTTKLRVVFDGSAKGSNGKSLNDQLLVGPTIQNDIFTILLQFRKFEVGLSADIEKMYRQILIHPSDRAYQSIVWRSDEKQEITTYQLNTITYGTSAAPFLAIRTLKQIAIDVQETNPTISTVLVDNFYVDDFMFSVPDLATANQIKTGICTVLSNAGLRLRKWSSNVNEFVQTIPEEDLAISPMPINDDVHTVKTLGLYWDITSNMFKYSVSIPVGNKHVTKRMVLSLISRIFDPIGWLAPFVTTLKLFMQKLWIRGIEWDSILSDDLLQQWNCIYDSMSDIHLLNVPRWMQYSNEIQVQLHGFADSSELAYAAVVYLKVVRDNGEVTTRLVASKTRVAPVKQVTIPRLELCACHLLTKLLLKVKNALKIDNVEIHGWTDSTIVLAWLSDHPRKWKNFVANRTSYVINILPAERWHHISSTKNPADLATRGMTPVELKNADLWWHGPAVLKDNKYTQEKSAELNTDLEQRSKTILHIGEDRQPDLMNDYSDFMTLLRLTATILRFIKNCKLQKQSRQTGFLNTVELQHAHNILIRRAQRESFFKEIRILSTGKQLECNHKLSALNPFIDPNGLLRVGGRLINARIPYNQKHPLILHKDHIFTGNIVRYYHVRNLHAGPRQLQYLLALKYWIPSVSHCIRRCVYKCTTCMRYRAKPFEQQMGNLPPSRLEASTAFQNAGVDFAGPLLIRSWKGRGSKRYKCWVAVFICLVTKAIHLELVTELTTVAFIACLRRFVSRRGKPNQMFSDNGTNFVGCNQKLKELVNFMLSEQTQEAIIKETAEAGIQWHFTPPSGPSFGGIWEAGVKSMKRHLTRILGNSILTYEEMSTVLCQVESCLNSRPLSAKFDHDTDPLTPAHFLIMKTMSCVPDQDVTKINMNRLTNWQRLQQLVQMFWKKWSVEYLNQLQSRPKWTKRLENLKPNDVVIIKDDQAPPCKWAIGKIIETHPGNDGLVRVVTIKTQKGVLKRPISKVCPLIVDC